MMTVIRTQASPHAFVRLITVHIFTGTLDWYAGACENLPQQLSVYRVIRFSRSKGETCTGGISSRPSFLQSAPDEEYVDCRPE